MDGKLVKCGNKDESHRGLDDINNLPRASCCRLMKSTASGSGKNELLAVTCLYIRIVTTTLAVSVSSAAALGYNLFMARLGPNNSSTYI